MLASGCRRDDQIQTYRVSKETQASMPMAAGKEQSMGEGMGSMPPDHPPVGSDMAPAATPKEISWKVPEGWQEQAPSSMRVGSFLIKGKTAQQADISVVPLSGMAGGDLANINRWRGQIGLDPISEADLPKQSQTLSPAGRKMLFVDFANGEKRLMAAIYTRSDRTWFFKMAGEDATVASAKPAFLQFLKSLTFNER